ncbi:hypothetical protein AYI70_g5732 [Smittium culicis]|uniref:Uncharacterized protein n=1 Tax=Smittium culicis TaxID=133412 RepID=A0A1R1XT56_9FUNG|nr:hypothetical protein AYI70_g5732 [Smittium culicis]
MTTINTRIRTTRPDTISGVIQLTKNSSSRTGSSEIIFELVLERVDVAVEVKVGIAVDTIVEDEPTIEVENGVVTVEDETSAVKRSV